MAFKSMASATESEILSCYNEARQREKQLPEKILDILRSFEQVPEHETHVTMLHHALQTASLAEEDGADEEVILMALLHDIGKHLSNTNHGPIAAAFLQGFLSDHLIQVIKTHEVFIGRFYYGVVGKDPEQYKMFSKEPWFDLAYTFTGDWDQKAFNHKYKVKPLEHFAPLVEKYLVPGKTKFRKTG